MSESGDPALIGRTVGGKYVVDKFLGGGAMGAVYRAHQASLDKKVALKVMHRQIAVDPAFVARFQREAKAASRLDHPNSMRVIDFGAEPDGLLYIAMEYLEGRDLFRVLHDDWPLPADRIGEIMMQVLAALAVAHDMGVIHRDLKPENVMVLRGKNDEGRDADVIKVCDFGIAKIMDGDEAAPTPGAPPGALPEPAARKLTTQGVVVGTPEYMSPEQARGEKLDPRSDLYSMGVILYHLLTGRTPFSADTPLAVVVKHLTQPPKPPREIPGFERVHPGLEAVCLKAMQKEPGARFQSAREMRAAVRAALDGRAASAELATAPTAALPASGPSLPSSPSGPLPTPAPAGGVQTGPTDVASAPTIAGPAMASSKVTPLGTAAAAAPQPARGSGKVVAAVALVAALVGAGALAGARAMHVGPFAKHTAAPADAPSAVPVMPTDVNAAPSAAPSSPPPEDAPRETAQREPPAPPAPSAPRPNGPHATTPTGRPNDLPHAAPAASAAAAPSSPVAPEPPPPSPPPAAPSSPVTPAPAVTPPAPPPVAAFDGTKCQAQVGAVRNLSAGATVSKLRYAHAATLWSRCGARLASRPSAGFMVRVAFAESGGAPRKVSCAGCPPEAIACLKQMTEQGVSLIKTGEEAEFELGGAFTCP